MILRRPICWTIAAIGVLVLPLGGCGEAQIAPAPLHDLAEPWQAQPFAVDPSLVTSAENVCRTTWSTSIPAGLPLLLVDARGANRMLLFFAGAGADYECFVVRDRTGRLKTPGGGGGSGPPRPPVGPNEIVGQGAGSESNAGEANQPETSVSYVIGRSGANVTVVEVVLAAAGPIRASVNRGWYAAWWPGSDTQVQARGYDAGGNLVGSSK
jgi:hypothetical protein